MKLSILDQVPISKGMTSTEALANSVKIAQLGDEIGYERMWLAEHHNTTSLASSAPEITAAYIAAKTERIRLGTGGIMMMHYSPLKIAEVFKTLAALAPNRIDFGAGRAPGGDGPAMTALASGRRPELTEQYDKLEIILNLMNEKSTGEEIYDQVVATPFKVTLPQAWLLGSSGQSARQAGAAGIGYSFAQFFNGQMSKAIFDAYRDSFQPSYFMEKPQIITTYAVSVAETTEEAEYNSMPMQIMRLNLMRGRLLPTISPQEANDYPLTEMDKVILDKNRPLMLIGTAKEVATQILEEQHQYGFDEAMINCNLHSIDQRLTAYRLLGEELLNS
ncbi:LLM class flavin-dependent oxidoreductase [Solibacillus sp. R5-41]|uniref:LLM class flavin-dependent oxidoreductase n=1 Tax=Solibacillus sp. R5-41 TaxID=2048654 RepID=UPI000C1294F7|nr:LLM class flavin-dependent oxidoreductase [Solibacillus sp. R5-41]ATP40598.1 LLM class flavin-dependent oxidoreductase [Solibacillus sp. R5-41]